MRTVFHEWQSYLNEVVPKDASDAQIEEIRRAFYAGAWGVYYLMMEATGDPDEEQCERNLTALQREIAGILADLRLVERLARL